MKSIYWLLLVSLGIFTIGSARAQSMQPPEPPDWPESFSTSEVMFNSSCLAGNGRIDVNLINRSTVSSIFRLEFEGLSARQRTVSYEDWGRISVTGRPSGNYTAVVKKDGVTVLEKTVSINCSDSQPVVSVPEVTILSACRSDRGQVFFQFVNPTSESRPYVIEFENVPNRSTTAAANGQAIRGTTGRPNGSYTYLVRTGGEQLASGVVDVACE